MRSSFSQDPLSACAILQDAGRVELIAQLRAVLHPASATNDDLAFQLVLDVSVGFIQPTIFEPILYKTKSAMSQVEEAQRRVLRYIFPPERPSSNRHALDVPSLYSAIRPATAVAAPLSEESFQPPMLVPALLPFQRRSVAWLLSREGKSLDVNGNAVSLETASSSVLPLFWRTMDGIEAEKWYFNDLTGMISASLPKDSSAAGGILAEEPGLGKTLESIAMILLNPAIGRNPTHKSWNTETRIFVKEVKVNTSLFRESCQIDYRRNIDNADCNTSLSCTTMGRRD